MKADPVGQLDLADAEGIAFGPCSATEFDLNRVSPARPWPGRG
jgi:hypothetical protein